MCRTCNNRQCHVQLVCNAMKDLGKDQVLNFLEECCVVKPIHVVKRLEEGFALLHFGSEEDAASFYYLYHPGAHMLSRRLPDVKVNPAFVFGTREYVQYRCSEVQLRICSSTGNLCRCAGINSTANDTNDTTDTTNESTDTITTTETTTTDTTTTDTTSTAPPSPQPSSSSAAAAETELPATAPSPANSGVTSGDATPGFVNECLALAKAELVAEMKRVWDEMEGLRSKYDALNKRKKYLDAYEDL